MNINPAMSPNASFKGNFVENKVTRQIREMAEKPENKNMKDALEKLDQQKEMVERGCSDGYFWELLSKDAVLTPESEVIMYKNGRIIGSPAKCNNLGKLTKSLEEPLAIDVLSNLKEMEKKAIIKKGEDFGGEFVTESPIWGLVNREAGIYSVDNNINTKAGNALKDFDKYRELARYTQNDRYELLPSGQVYDIPNINIKMFRNLRNIGAAGTYKTLDTVLESSKAVIMDDVMQNLKRLNIKSGFKRSVKI